MLFPELSALLGIVTLVILTAMSAPLGGFVGVCAAKLFGNDTERVVVDCVLGPVGLWLGILFLMSVTVEGSTYQPDSATTIRNIFPYPVHVLVLSFILPPTLHQFMRRLRALSLKP